MTRILRFENVGRSKWSGDKKLHPEHQTPDEIADAAYEEARKHLMSHDVEAVYDASTNKGTIEAGFHTAGHFTVIEVE